jgi:hypothetical protein
MQSRCNNANLPFDIGGDPVPVTPITVLRPSRGAAIGDALRNVRLAERDATEETRGADDLVEAGPRDAPRDEMDRWQQSATWA